MYDLQNYISLSLLSSALKFDCGLSQVDRIFYRNYNLHAVQRVFIVWRSHFLSTYFLGVLKPLLSQESSARALPSSVKGDTFNVSFDVRIEYRNRSATEIGSYKYTRSNVLSLLFNSISYT